MEPGAKASGGDRLISRERIFRDPWSLGEEKGEGNEKEEKTSHGDLGIDRTCELQIQPIHYSKQQS